MLIRGVCELKFSELNGNNHPIGNWRITFEFQDGNAFVLDYEDYH